MSWHGRCLFGNGQPVNNLPARPSNVFLRNCLRGHDNCAFTVLVLISILLKWQPSAEGCYTKQCKPGPVLACIFLYAIYYGIEYIVLGVVALSHQQCDVKPTRHAASKHDCGRMCGSCFSQAILVTSRQRLNGLNIASLLNKKVTGR
jgi:hypothetical protein